MNEAEDIAFFRSTTAATARSLPLSDAIRFLHGVLLVAGEHEDMAEVREAYIRLHESDAQLELLARPQARLL